MQPFFLLILGHLNFVLPFVASVPSCGIRQPAIQQPAIQEHHLQKKARKYIGRAKKLDIKQLLLEEVTNLLPYLQYVFRSFREEIRELDRYEETQKGDLFQMQIGEFYELRVAILQVAKKKNEKLLHKRIRRDEILSGYDLSALNLDG